MTPWSYYWRQLLAIFWAVVGFPGRMIVKWGLKAQADWYPQYRRAELAEKRISALKRALELKGDANWREECGRLQLQVQKLKAEVTDQNRSLEKKNRDLDALHYVWCNGGCGGGVHRYDKKGPEGLTEETVRLALHNVNRMVTYFNNAEFKHLDQLDGGGVRNRFYYSKVVRGVQAAEQIAATQGPAAAWEAVKQALEKER